jgi:four helix bundle protein
MQDFRKLKVWEKAHTIALKIYAITMQFPREEVFGLTSQLRRSAASIPTNIAEGCGRGTHKELSQFLQIAMGSASEMEYLLILAKELNYLKEEIRDQCTQDIVEIKKMLSSLVHRLNTNN